MYSGSLILPGSPQELAEALAGAAARGASIALGGAFTKRAMAGPCAAADAVISTAALNRIRRYEPRDLTISVEAGVPYAEVRRTLAAHGQALPLDPPFAGKGSIGGVLAANLSGPRRLLYGTARDMVIGMEAATLDGKLVQSGGMVVKSVAGLDVAKLMIGSFGTLAAIAVANFKVVPAPRGSRTFILAYGSVEEAARGRDALRRTALRPAAMDLLNPAAAARLGRERSWLLLVRAHGSEAALARYARETPGAEVLEGEGETALWEAVEEFTPRFFEEHGTGAVVRVSAPITKVGEVMASFPGPAVARAATGVVWGCFSDWREARGRNAVVEFAPEEAKRELVLWPNPGDDFPVMQRIKRLFDPAGLLNRGRLYGRI